MTTTPAGPSRTTWMLYEELLGLAPFGSLTPEERAAAIPDWMNPCMIATPHAEARLRRWVEAGGMKEPDSLDRRRELIGDIWTVGDEGLRVCLHEALERLPPPVLQHLVYNAGIATLGVSVRGWCLTRWPHEGQIEGTQWLIAEFKASSVPNEVPSSEEFMATVGHEAAHAWLLPPMPLQAPPLTDGERAAGRDHHARLLACAHEWGLVGQVSERFEEPERQAGALARAWGFRGAAADGDGCARGLRAHMKARAAALHAQHYERISSEVETS
jgi:hypothetical protein